MNSEPELLRCAVIEDEDQMRRWLCDRLREFPEVEIIGEAASVDSAFHLLNRERPDALFLDVKLIGGSAFDLLNRLRANRVPIPAIVIITGDDEHAIPFINQWHGEVVRYLTKPFIEEWQNKIRDCIDALCAATSRFAASLPQPPLTNPARSHLFVRNADQDIRIDFDAIRWLEVAGGGAVYVVSDRQTIRLNQTLNQLLEHMPPYIMRISRDTAVNLNRIMRVDRSDRGVFIDCNGTEKFLGVGDAYYPALLHHLDLIK